MLVVRTTEDPAYPICKFISSQKTVGFYDLALCVYPLGLDGVQPRTLLRKKATHDPYPFAALLDFLAVMFSEPAPDLTAYVPALALSQMRSRTFLPRASSLSQHHERNRVVMALTGRPSTNLIHVWSSSGT
jgi:hypothetical protein